MNYKITAFGQTDEIPASEHEESDIHQAALTIQAIFLGIVVYIIISTSTNAAKAFQLLTEDLFS